MPIEGEEMKEEEDDRRHRSTREVFLLCYIRTIWCLAMFTLSLLVTSEPPILMV